MTAPSLLDELEGVVKFLLGERPLDGRWFGDDPPVTASGMKRHYWWRTDLRKAHADMAKRLEAAERDSKRLDWVEDRAHALDWDPNQSMKRVIRGDDGAEFCGDTWREQIDAAAQEGEG